MEIWKEIPNTNGKLCVSNMGRVRSTLRHESGHILATQPDHKGYRRLRVTIDRDKRCYKLHRLVAEAFVDRPAGKYQVNHINGNKDDNRACNLEWVTNQENAIHAREAGLWDSVIAGSVRANEAKKTPIIATNIDTGESLYFESMSAAERAIGTRHINQVLSGIRGQAKGHTFRYARGGDVHVS